MATDAKGKRCDNCHHSDMMHFNDILLCPECYHAEFEDRKWKGKTTACPKCDNMVRIYHSDLRGKRYHCVKCNTIGHIMNEKDFEKKIYKVDKKSPVGKRLSWLFEIPCRHWVRRDSIPDIKTKYCKGCDIKKVCDAHTRLIDEFTQHKDYEVYISTDFIEIVMKG